MASMANVGQIVIGAPAQVSHVALSATPQSTLTTGGVPAALTMSSYTHSDVSVATKQAWTEHIRKLTPLEMQYFTQYTAGDLAAYAKLAQNACKNLEDKSWSQRICNLLTPVFRIANMYIPVAAAAAQADPNPSFLVLGAVMCILQLGMNLKSYQEKVAKTLSSMGRQANIVLRLESQLFHNDTEVQSAAIKVYGDILDFCREAFKLFVNEKGEVKSGLSTFKVTLFHTFESKMGGYVEKYEQDIAELRHHMDFRDKMTLQTVHDQQIRHNAHAEAALDVLTAGMSTLDRQQRGTNLALLDMHNQSQREARLKKRQLIFEWIRAVDLLAIQDEKLEARLEGTAMWLFQRPEYEQWRENTQSDLIFVQGKPGCGKSILAASTINELDERKTEQDALCFTYCSTTRDPLVLLGSMLRQLSLRLPDIDPALENMYDSLVQQYQNGPSWDHLSKCFAEISSVFSSAYVIIDGLDECNDPGRILKLFRSLILKPTALVKIIVFSRPEVLIGIDIQNHISVDTGGNDDDIREFITKVVLESSTVIRKESADFDSIRETLLSKAENMFLWIKLQADELTDHLTKRQFLDTVNALPEGLHSVYNACFQKIAAKPKLIRQTAFKLLFLATNATRVMSLAETLEAVVVYPSMDAIEVDDRIQDATHLKKLCASLIDIDTAGNISLVHASLVDYLKSCPALDSFPFPEYVEMQRNAGFVLGQICLTYLRFSPFQVGPFESPQELDDFIALNPFLNYASNSWGQHVDACELGELDDEVMRFVNKSGNRELALQIALKETDLNPFPFSGETSPLHLLSLFGQLRIAKSVELTKEAKFQVDCQQALPLDYAATRGHRDMCEWYLEPYGNDGELARLASSGCLSVLNIAARCDWLDIAKRLIALGWNVNYHSGRGRMTALNYACVFGSRNVAHELIDAGADIECRDSEMETPLIHTARILRSDSSKSDLAHFVIENGANVNTSATNGLTAVHLAAYHGDATLTDLLIARGAMVDCEAFGDFTAMQIAVQYNHIKVVSLLHKAKADPERLRRNGIAPLHIAAKYGFVEAAGLFKSIGCNDKIRDASGRQPLHYAAQHGQERSLLFCLDYGADVNATTISGDTALHLAAKEGSVNTVKCLLQHWASTNIKSRGKTPLFKAIRRGNIDVSKLLIDYGANPFILDKKGRSLWHISAAGGYASCIEFLASLGLDEKAIDNDGNSACHSAAVKDHMRFIEELLRVFPRLNINRKNHLGQTILHMAADKKDNRLLHLLIDRNASSSADEYGNLPMHYTASNGDLDATLKLATPENMETSGYRGQRILHYASHSGRVELVEKLVALGADVNATDIDGYSPLMDAIRANETNEVAHFLMSHEASIDHTDNSGNTVLDYAVEKGDVELVTALLGRGLDPLSKSPSGYTPLATAISLGHSTVVDLILAHDPKRNARALKEVQKSGGTALHSALEVGDLPTIRKILSACVDTTPMGPWNLMHLSAKHGDPHLIDFWSQRGISITETVSLIGTPADVAAEGGMLGFVERLVRLGADFTRVATYSKTSPLSTATFNGFVSIVKCLLGAGANPFQRDSLWRNAIDYAKDRSRLMEIFRQRNDICPDSLSDVKRSQLLRRSSLRHIDDLYNQGLPTTFEEGAMRSEILLSLGASLLNTNNEQLIHSGTLCYAEFLHKVDDISFTCIICRRSYTKVKMHVSASYYDTFLCAECHQRYAKNDALPETPPAALAEYLRLEREIYLVREKVSFSIDVAYSLAGITLVTHEPLKAWIDQKVEEYDAWQASYNRDHYFDELEQPGLTFLRDIEAIAEMEQQSPGRFASLPEENGDSVTSNDYRTKQRFKQHCRMKEQVPSFTCLGDQFFEIASVDENSVSSGDFDTRGRLTRSWIARLKEKLESFDNGPEDLIEQTKRVDEEAFAAWKRKRGLESSRIDRSSPDLPKSGSREGSVRAGDGLFGVQSDDRARRGPQSQQCKSMGSPGVDEDGPVTPGMQNALFYEVLDDVYAMSEAAALRVSKSRDHTSAKNLFFRPFFDKDNDILKSKYENSSIETDDAFKAKVQRSIVHAMAAKYENRDTRGTVFYMILCYRLGRDVLSQKHLTWILEVAYSLIEDVVKEEDFD